MVAGSNGDNIIMDLINDRPFPYLSDGTINRVPRRINGHKTLKGSDVIGR